VRFFAPAVGVTQTKDDPMKKRKIAQATTRNATRREAERVRRLTELQVREYNERYHPEMGDVSVEIRGNIVVVRSNSQEKSR